jgi:hypothetical protein
MPKEKQRIKSLETMEFIRRSPPLGDFKIKQDWRISPSASRPGGIQEIMESLERKKKRTGSF